MNNTTSVQDQIIRNFEKVQICDLIEIIEDLDTQLTQEKDFYEARITELEEKVSELSDLINELNGQIETLNEE